MNVTVIVPSLDPDEKLMQVVEGLLKSGFRDILLVNDGSDDAHTAPFLEAAQHPEVTVLTHEVNRGKGCALKTAFAWCMEHRPDIDGVVTADGDNQHAPEDIRRCAETMTAQPDRVWLGVRDFSLEHVPLRSRLGNTITRFIMRLGGVSVTDTQTGLRAIPAALLPLMCQVEGERYEYETEMLIALHEHQIPVGEVVIETVYIDNNQTSHFNAVKDSWKIYRIIFRHLGRSSFLRYALNSLLCMLLDYLVFHLMNVFILSPLTNAPLRTTLSNCTARVISATVNYTANRRFAFRSSSSVGRSALRYFLLAVAQLAASSFLISAISRLTAAPVRLETLIKVFVDTGLFFLSYQIQKHWVFKKD